MRDQTRFDTKQMKREVSKSSARAGGRGFVTWQSCCRDVVTCRCLSQLVAACHLSQSLAASHYGMEGRICCSTAGSPSPLFTLFFPPSSSIPGKFSVSPSDVVSPDESVLRPRQSKEVRGWMIPKSSCADNCLRRAANKKLAGRIRPQPRSTSRPILLIHSS